MTTRDGVICMGHRGAAAHAPENTIPSILEGIQRGASWIEVDVWCVEDELAVHHDERLERTTNGTGSISSISKTALRALDAGHGARVPWLREVLEVCATHGVGVNIELKGEGTGARVGAYLQETGLEVDVIVSSFKLPELQAAQGLRCCLLTEFMGPWVWDIAKELGAWALHPQHALVDAPLLAQAREFGMRVNVWTVNEPEEVERLLDLGVDGIITDRPELVMQAKKNKEA